MLIFNSERWPSGLRRTPGKRVHRKVSGVRIPPPPPNIDSKISLVNKKKPLQLTKTMKKLFALFTLLAVMSLGMNNFVYAQTDGAEEAIEAVEDAVDESMDAAQEAVQEDLAAVEEAVEEVPAQAEKEVTGFHQTVKKYFIEGDAKFMAFVLICLILGLALCIERIIYLNMATTNTRKLLDKVEEAMNNGGVEAAKEVCRNTSGPVAAIFYQGLDRSNEDIEIVEKSIEQYGSVQMGILEKGLS